MRKLYSTVQFLGWQCFPKYTGAGCSKADLLNPGLTSVSKQTSQHLVYDFRNISSENMSGLMGVLFYEVLK